MIKIWGVCIDFADWTTVSVLHEAFIIFHFVAPSLCFFASAESAPGSRPVTTIVSYFEPNHFNAPFDTVCSFEHTVQRTTRLSSVVPPF
jgi:hypothetical protein